MVNTQLTLVVGGLIIGLIMFFGFLRAAEKAPVNNYTGTGEETEDTYSCLRKDGCPICESRLRYYENENGIVRCGI